MFYTEGDLQSRYGANSWVLVTGASDGIGKEFCFQMAKRGFNIVLVAKNPEKTTEVEEEVKQRYPTIQAKTIIADFRDSAKDGFFEKIMTQVKGLDISILVNNVGIYTNEEYHKDDLEELQNMVLVNCLPQVILTRYMIPRFLERKKKSAIINMASIAGTFPRPHAPIYSATKVFNDYLARGLRESYKEIDIISLRPKYITSQMTDYKKPGIDTSHPKYLIENALVNLGKRPVTSGDWKHRFIEWKYLNLPRFMTGFK